MNQVDTLGGKALTWRSAVVALFMVLLWVIGSCFMAVHIALYTHQLLMILVFGAILTIFLLRFPGLFLVSLVFLWGGTCVLMYTEAPRADQAIVLGGITWSLVAFLPLLALGIWIKIKPLRRTELAIIYACVLIAIPWCVSIKAVIESSTANLFESQQRAVPQVYKWARQMPWWGPTIPAAKDVPVVNAQASSAEAKETGGDVKSRKAEPAVSEADRRTREAIYGFAKGNGGKVPWGVWWRPILYWTAMCLAFEAMLMGLLLLFRRRWIEHERLPFVWSQPALHLLRGDPAAGGGNRRAWIMFAIGIGVCLPGILMIGPSGQPMSDWTIIPWVGQEGLRGGFDLTELNLLPKTELKLWWGPMVLAMLLLFPVDILMTTALTYVLVNLLIPGLMRTAGLQVGPQRMFEFVRWGLRAGGCAGLLIWSAWFALLDWRRSARGSHKVKPESPDDPGYLPRGPVIALAVGGLVTFVALGCYATTAIQMLLLTGFVLVYAFSQVRQRIEGMPVIYENNITSHQMTSIQRDFLGDHYTLAQNDPSIPITPSSWATHWMQWGFAGQLKSFGPHNMLLEAFKIAHEMKIHARVVAKAILVTMLI